MSTDRRGTPRRAAPLLLLLALAVVPLPAATGSCAGPQLEVPGAGDGVPVLVPGTSQTVRGQHFVDGCDDTGGGDVFGCSEEPAEEEVPYEDVTLVLRQGDRTWELGTVDAGTAEDGRLGQVEWQAEVPDEVRRGRAVLRAGGTRLPVRVVPAP